MSRVRRRASTNGRRGTPPGACPHTARADGELGASAYFATGFSPGRRPIRKLLDETNCRRDVSHPSQLRCRKWPRRHMRWSTAPDMLSAQVCAGSRTLVALRATHSHHRRLASCATLQSCRGISWRRGVATGMARLRRHRMGRRARRWRCRRPRWRIRRRDAGRVVCADAARAFRVELPVYVGTDDQRVATLSHADVALSHDMPLGEGLPVKVHISRSRDRSTYSASVTSP